MLPPLITELAAGIRSGNLPASGATANFYYPGTFTRAINVFDDDGVTPVLSTTLDSDGRAFVRTAAPVRLVVQDAAGLTVFDHEVPGSAADSCAVQNTFWNGGVKTTLQSILSSLGVSLGADGLIKPGATSLGIGLADWTKGVHIDVTGEDAGGNHRVVGDDLTDCTTGIQTALALAAARGGGVVYAPPGMYRFSGPLSITANGVALVGAGAGVTVFKNTGAGAAVSVASGLTGVVLQDFSVTHLTSSADAALKFVSDVDCATIRVSAEKHFYGIYAEECTGLMIQGGTLRGSTSIGSRPLCFVGTGANAKHIVVVGTKAIATHAADNACEVAGTQGKVFLLGASLSSSSWGFEIDAACTGRTFRLLGCDVSGASSAIKHGPANDCDFYCDSQIMVESTVGGGGTVTPNRAASQWFMYTATGATATIAAPTPAPGSYTAMPLLHLMLYNNDAALGTTTWTLDAIFHAAAAIDTTYHNVTSITFMWQTASGGCWREISRAVTT